MQSLIVFVSLLLCALGEGTFRPEIFSRPIPNAVGNTGQIFPSRKGTVESAFESRASCRTSRNLGQILGLTHRELSNVTRTSHSRLNNSMTTNPTNVSDGSVPKFSSAGNQMNVGHHILVQTQQPASGTVVLKRSIRAIPDFLGLERDAETSDDEDLPIKDSDQEISVNEDSGHKSDLEPKISEDIDDREGEISDEEDPPVKEPDHDISVDESLDDDSNKGRGYDDEQDEY